MADNYETLRSKSVEQLKLEYDRIAQSTQIGLNFYREEIARRETAEQSERMLQLTQSMRTLTVAVLALSAVSVIAAGGSLWLALVNR